SLFIDEQRRLAVNDGAPVLHGAGLEIGHGNLVELRQRVLNAVVVVVVVENRLGRVQREARQVFLARNSADIQLDAVHLVGGTLPIANRQRNQVAGHLRRSGKLDGVLVAGASSVGDDLAVGNGGVALVHNRGDIKGRLVGRLVKAGESHARVGGLHLRHFVLPAVVSAQIEAAQLVVEMTGVLDVQGGWTRGKLLVHGERRHLVLFVSGDLRGLGLATSGYGHLMKIDFHGIEGDGVAGLVELEINDLVALVAIVREIDVDGKPVMFGRGAARKALRKRRATGKQTSRQHEQNSFHITPRSKERFEDAPNSYERIYVRNPTLVP